jgi:hypothetical protein
VEETMAKKKPSSNLLLRGADGELYFISEDQLQQFRIPNEAAKQLQEQLHLDGELLAVYGDEDDEDEATAAAFTSAAFTSSAFTASAFSAGESKQAQSAFVSGAFVTFMNVGAFVSGAFTGRKKK